MQKIIIYLIMGLFLAACTYKPDIQQGNMVTGEKLAQLKPGMDKNQVIFILGPPMLADPFHKERWDYFYSFKAGRKDTTRHGATLYFKDGFLTRIESRGEIPPEEYPDAGRPVF